MAADSELLVEGFAFIFLCSSFIAVATATQATTSFTLIPLSSSKTYPGFITSLTTVDLDGCRTTAGASTVSSFGTFFFASLLNLYMTNPLLSTV